MISFFRSYYITILFLYKIFKNHIIALFLSTIFLKQIDILLANIEFERTANLSL